jgi:hypothetical protein
LLCAIRAQDLGVSCARGHTLVVDEQVCTAAGPSSALHDCVCHSCSNGTSNSAACVYRLDGFVTLSIHGLGACFCGATSCAVSCGANNRPVCLACSREPSASACADRCRLLPSCVALEFVEHPIEGTWCHLLQAKPARPPLLLTPNFQQRLYLRPHPRPCPRHSRKNGVSRSSAAVTCGPPE